MKAPVVEWLLDAATSANASGVALQAGKSAWSHAQLAQRMLRTAAALRSQGVTAGARVGLALGTGEAYVSSLLGILALGATAVPLSPLYRRKELAFHMRANRVVGVVTDALLAPTCAAAIGEATLSGPIWSFGESRTGVDLLPLIERASQDLEPADVSSDDVAIVLHTAGSTGRSKLVPRTHGQLRAECDNVAQSLRTSTDDVIFGMLPLHHCHGLMNCLLAALRARCRLVLHTDPRPFVLVREDVLRQIRDERITILPAIPFQFEVLLMARTEIDLPSLRLCYTGGAALGREIFDGFKKRFGVLVRQEYGCTEAGAVTLNLGDNLDATWMTAGQPLAGTRVSILDPDREGIGEIVIATDALTSGYEGLDELNREVFVDGAFRTGDLGCIDRAGNLQITRRRPIYLDVAGHKVDSSEVEATLAEVPGVVDVLVVATQTRPAAIKAVIVASQPLRPTELREFCRHRLASYKVPSVFEFRNTMPRDPTGKRTRKDLL